MYSREGAGDLWLRLPSVYDPEFGKVTAQSDHLSEFTVMGATAGRLARSADCPRPR